MPQPMTEQELTKLNHLIKEYYGNEYNVFFFQGIFASYLCWPSFSTPRELIFGEEPILEPLQPFTEKPQDLDILLFYGLYNQTLAGCKTVNFVPILSLQGIKGKPFRYMTLNSNEQFNLLQWLFGFLHGFFAVCDLKAIRQYVKKNYDDLEAMRFWGLLDSIIMTFINLVETLDYKAIKSSAHYYIIKQANSSAKKLDMVSRMGAEMAGKVSLCKVIGELIKRVNQICRTT